MPSLLCLGESGARAMPCCDRCSIASKHAAVSLLHNRRILAKERQARADYLVAVDVGAKEYPVAHRPRNLIAKPLFALTANLHFTPILSMKSATADLFDIDHEHAVRTPCLL